MTTSAPFPVNIFLRERDLHLHGLMNLLPTVGLLGLAGLLYSWVGLIAALITAALALLVLVWYTILTYWYTNTMLTVSSTGLHFAGHWNRTLSFADITMLEFGYAAYSPESVLRPIALVIYLQDGTEQAVFLYKKHFVTPKRLFQRLHITLLEQELRMQIKLLRGL